MAWLAAGWLRSACWRLRSGQPVGQCGLLVARFAGRCGWPRAAESRPACIEGEEERLGFSLNRSLLLSRHRRLRALPPPLCRVLVQVVRRLGMWLRLPSSSYCTSCTLMCRPFPAVGLSQLIQWSEGSPSARGSKCRARFWGGGPQPLVERRPSQERALRRAAPPWRWRGECCWCGRHRRWRPGGRCWSLLCHRWQPSGCRR
jgi:hypothetical protein